MADELMDIDSDEVEEAIRLVVRRTREMDFTWEWPCGVAFYGVTRASEVLKEQEYITYLAEWVDEYISIGLPHFMVNTVSMGHTLIALYQATDREKYLELAMKKADYLETKARRFRGGILQHTVSENDDFPGQAWADTLFMAAYFLLRLGRIVDNEAYVEDALLQFTGHEELLQDHQTNLFYHGYEDETRSHMSGVFWGRANAWAAYTMSRALSHVNYLYPEFMAIEGSLRDQLSSLVRIQSPNGLWHTVLDDPETYEETSASAGIAAALVEFGHPLHRKSIVRAYRGIISNIDNDGSVRNVSAGTAVMKTVRDYDRVPRKRVQGWGQGLTLAFLTSLLDYQNRRKPSTEELPTP